MKSPEAFTYNLQSLEGSVMGEGIYNTLLQAQELVPIYDKKILKQNKPRLDDDPGRASDAAASIYISEQRVTMTSEACRQTLQCSRHFIVILLKP